MRTHKNLDVYNRSINFVTNIYRLTSAFPKEEQFGLTSQLRRASVSIPSNIAEGSARQSLKEYIQFLYIALASASELETQLLISNNLRFINEINYKTSSEELLVIIKMLQALINSLKK